MPTTFNVISLGQLTSIDPTEGNYTAEDAGALTGMTFGGPDAPLLNDVQSLSNTGAGFSGGGSRYYDMNNANTNDTFSIDGGPAQTFDGTSVYNATITYTDGATDTITAVIFQDTGGNTYLAPEFSANADQAALEAGAIRSLTLDSLAGSTYSGMTGSRESFDFVICFVEGTRLETATGLIPIEQLTKGQLLVTRDNGLCPLRWIGRSTCAALGRFRPVSIAAGTLGRGLPQRDLRVSQQHRMMIKSRIAERMTGNAEVLVPAKKLLGCEGVRMCDRDLLVTYYHVLLDRHEIIFAEGAPTESLMVGPMTCKSIGKDLFDELSMLFPDLLVRGGDPARFIPKGHKIRQLLARHVKNAKPLL